ncbi:MAG: ADP-ribosylglycohydrolase family protein [Thermomicrobiaceae bacterium]
MNAKQDHARGCLFGQLIGDALGSLVEFQSPDQISSRYPGGVRDMHDGGTWNTIAGQPTDDSEMALALARSIVENGRYDQNAAREAYIDWLNSGPFDIGNTVRAGLQGTPNYESQANGALMRISPLGIFTSGIDEDRTARYAREDAWITHPNEVTQDANVVFVLTVAQSINKQLTPPEAFEYAENISAELHLVDSVRQALVDARDAPPATFLRSQGWVLIALQNAFYQLLNQESFEEALVDTVGRGGDTDTNAAICGALLGAVHGLSAIPARWVEIIRECKPESGSPGVNRPRPRRFWPVDADTLADQLLVAETHGANAASDLGD